MTTPELLGAGPIQDSIRIITDKALNYIRDMESGPEGNSDPGVAREEKEKEDTGCKGKNKNKGKGKNRKT